MTVYNKGMEPRWTIQQLADVVWLSLERLGYRGQNSARVREVPDARTIRYYTTLGIVDRPIEFRGRTAYYGRKHLLQLVAIKRLQARGLSLLEVQKCLAGADEARLVGLAELPADFWDRLAGAEAEARGRSGEAAAAGVPAKARCDRFWASLPEAAEPMEPCDEGVKLGVCPAISVELGPGIRLVIEGVDAAAPAAVVREALKPALAKLAMVIRHLGGTNGSEPNQNLDGRDEHDSNGNPIGR